DWVEGGTLKGNNPNALPAVPKFEPQEPFSPGAGIDVTGELSLTKDITLDGLIPQRVPKGTSLQVVATLPNGLVEPLVWLYEFDDATRHPFRFRRPIMLPAGTVVHGVRPPTRLRLLESVRKSSRCETHDVSDSPDFAVALRNLPLRSAIANHRRPDG